MAHIVSVVFHPLFMPLWIFLMLLFVDPVLSLYFNGQLLWWSLSFLIINTIVGPALSILIMKKRGILSSITMPDLKGRSLAYLITFLYHVWNFIMFRKAGIPAIMEGMMIGLLVVLAILALISLTWKISAHMAAMGGMLAVVLWMSIFYGAFNLKLTISVILLTGLVASSRSILGAHDYPQLIGGTLVGCLGIFTAMILAV